MAFIKHSLIAAASILCVADAGGNTGATGGFRWGNWAEWESCRKVGKNQTRRRVCMGPITNRKVAKERCIEHLDEGFNVETRTCEEEDLKKDDGLKTRMDSPFKATRWQEWQSWSRCSSNTRKRYRYCGDAFKREIQPNRVCKNYGGREYGGRSANGVPKQTNKEVEQCGGLYDSGREEQGRFDAFSRLNVKLSAPECYHPPGTELNESNQPALPMGMAAQRIVGGKASTHGDNPHIVMLSYKGFGGYGQFCDGSIIHNRYVLTAAHCFVGWDESPATYEVVVGAYNKVDKSTHQETYFLESITCHESYRVSSRQIIYDICLLKTTKDIQFNEFVWPICLPDDLPPPNDGSYGKNCTVAGWGDTRFTGDERVLNEVDVPVLTYETCVDWYEAENILIDTEQHVCAGYEQGGLDACQGDSGGPFVCRRDLTKIGGQHKDLKVLTGIVSFGVGCAQEKNPGVYSNVNYFLPYIFKIVHEHDACMPTNPCQNGGFCIDTFHGYNCECNGNFVGKNCETNTDDVDACFENACQNGACIVEGDSYRCECEEDFRGTFCEILTNPCRNINCNSGTCSLINGAPKCNCESGWTGPTCDSDIDECTTGTDQCTSDATCKNTQGGYECQCASGFDGNGRSDGSGCQDIDECTERMHNCGPQSVCNNNAGGFSCSCRNGFTGNPPAIKCQKSKSKSPGECKNIVDDFQHGIYLKYDDGSVRYDVECGVGGETMSFSQLLANVGTKHPITQNPGGQDYSSACKISCKPGQIGQFPAFSRVEGGQKARIECLPKKLRPMWKPNKNQIRCFGCNPIAGVTLSDCDVKGKKAVNCQATCANGNPGSWTIKCQKFRGKFSWAKNSDVSVQNSCGV
jgi:hypothetical protein